MKKRVINPKMTFVVILIVVLFVISSYLSGPEDREHLKSVVVAEKPEIIDCHAEDPRRDSAVKDLCQQFKADPKAFVDDSILYSSCRRSLQAFSIYDQMLETAEGMYGKGDTLSEMVSIRENLKTLAPEIARTECSKVFSIILKEGSEDWKTYRRALKLARPRGPLTKNPSRVQA